MFIARQVSQMTMTRLRFQRSASAPATRPKRRYGSEHTAATAPACAGE